MFEKDIRAVVVKEEEIYHETLYDILFITDLCHSRDDRTGGNGSRDRNRDCCYRDRS